jgi:hypothetical protein
LEHVGYGVETARGDGASDARSATGRTVELSHLSATARRITTG